MHRYLFGILLLQIVTLAIFWLNTFAIADANPHVPVIDVSLLLRVAIPSLLLAITTAFWFGSIGRAGAARAIARLQDHHAKEREKIQINAEKAKTRLIEQTRKEINKETRRVSYKANFKVGLAFLAAAGAGIVLIITELVTLGMMTMTTVGGALSGYVMRGRRDRAIDLARTAGTPMSQQAQPGVQSDSVVTPANVRLSHSNPSAGSSKSPVKGGVEVKVINPDDVVG